MFVKNLEDIVSPEILAKNYYKCNYRKAKKLVHKGFQPISKDKKNKYIFFKTQQLIQYLNKGGDLGDE